MASTDTDIDTYRPAANTSTRTRASEGPKISIPPMMVMSPEGDVILVVPSSKGTAPFQVDSHILCATSRVFRDKLDKDSRFPEAGYELNLPHDNQKPLAVVLRVLHGKNSLVPKSLTESQLYEVAVICDKYDLAAAVTLWADRWIPHLVPNESAKPPTVIGHKWLYIAYVFRREQLFHALTQELILTSTIDESGALVMNATDGTGSNEFLQLRILHEIMSCRQQCIESMIDNVYQLVDRYSKVNSTDLECKHTTPEEPCDSFVVGFLLRTFKRKEVYPVASSEITRKSIRQIKKILDDITFPAEIYCSKTPGPTTLNCIYCLTRNSQTRQVDSRGYCSTCRYYTFQKLLGHNHSTTCSPVSNFKKDIQAIYDKVVGLDGECFVRVEQERCRDAFMPQAGQSLWDLIEY